MFHRVKSERQPQEEDQKDEVLEQDDEETSSDDSDEYDDDAADHEEAQDDADDADEVNEPAPASNLDIPGTPPYQRGLQNRPSSPVGSTSGFGASNIPKAGPSSSSSSDTSAEGGSRLTIGRGITMSGEIEACDYLLVEGTVEAALKGARALDIAESGTFYGTVEIDNATVAGRFEGDLTVSGRLTVKASGVITGTISYSELAVEAGAVIEGSLTPISAEGMSSSSHSGSSKHGAKGKKGKRPQPANNDGQLFKATAAE